MYPSVRVISTNPGDTLCIEVRPQRYFRNYYSIAPSDYTQGWRVGMLAEIASRKIMPDKAVPSLRSHPGRVRAVLPIPSKAVQGVRGRCGHFLLY